MESGRVKRLKQLFKGIDPENDVFLGETSVQIRSFDGTPSVHLVKSYMIPLDNYTHYYYHVFQWKCGTTAINFNKRQYDDVSRYIDLSDYWDVYYKDDEIAEPFPVNNEWRYV